MEAETGCPKGLFRLVQWIVLAFCGYGIYLVWMLAWALDAYDCTTTATTTVCLLK